MKVQVWVDIPDGYELACAEMRPPNDREMFISERGYVERFNKGVKLGPRIIIRPAWQWPNWIRAEWIAMDSDGLWWCYTVEPNIYCDEWRSCELAVNLETALLDFTPPHCTDWRTSKRRNPRTKNHG